MSTEMKVPPVGESIAQVTISKWLKNDGEAVSADEIICELESEKATFELTAETNGILRIKVQEGETVDIGAVICSIEAASVQQNNKVEAVTTEQKPESKKSETIEMKVPSVGESINEVTIGNWLKENGTWVEKEEILCEIESDKATFELPADASGELEIVAQQGDTLEIGALICRIKTGESKGKPTGGAEKEAKPVEKMETANHEKSYAAGHASPAAGKILHEKGILAADVKGSGVEGRITKEDAMNAQKMVKETPASGQTIAQQVVMANGRSYKRQKMTSLRKTIAKRLVAAKNETAMLTTFNEVDMKPIMDIRAKYKDKFKEKHQVGLGFMSFFTRACCVALQEWPAVNAFIDGDEIIYNDFIDVSVAVSAPKGLVVPVIRNAENLSFDQIEKKIVELATKAKDNKLTIEEMTGGTFSITNGGIFGSMLSTPILNAPQSAILGMHNIVDRAMVVDGNIVVRPMMYLALSYDHRIIDGREAVSFLVRVKQLLEDPTRLLLGV